MSDIIRYENIVTFSITVKVSRKLRKKSGIIGMHRNYPERSSFRVTYGMS